MSVINQMLRDLDAREASAQERAGLPNRLRPLPPARNARRKTWQVLALGILLGALGAGLGVGLVLSDRAPEPAAPTPVVPTPASPPQAAVPAPAPVPAPVESDTKAVAEPPVAIQTPVSEPAAISPPPQQMAPKTAEAAKAAKPAAVVKDGKDARDLKAAPAAQKPSAPSAAVPAAAAPIAPAPTKHEPAADAQIDKRTTAGQGRELAEAEYRKGMQAAKRGESAAAVPVLQRALEFDPTHAKARQTLLSVLVGSKQWNEAQRIAQAGLALEPQQTGWAAILARLQFEQGDIGAALETLGRHAAHAGSDAEYHGLFAYLLQKQQRYAEAAQHFQTALALRPQESRWWFGLGLALESIGRTGEAREAYAKAREGGGLPADMTSIVEQKLKQNP